MESNRSLEGIISYLTQKYGGNVHDNGIVTITSQSVAWGDDSCAPKNVADLATYVGFASKEGRGEWICWDFREMLVRPTHYTIRSIDLSSWVIEGSVDGANWNSIDERLSSWDSVRYVASFAVSNAVECRFLRLTRAGERRLALKLRGVEFFGTLFE
jgi:hypothetical protein